MSLGPQVAIASIAEQLRWLRDFIYRYSGIYHLDNKIHLVERACQRRMSATGIVSLEQYCELLENPARKRAETAELFNEITIGETSFFRNQPQLEAFRQKIVPEITKQKRLPRHLRVWSAGCSTGEEPYTIAMLLLEMSSSELRGWDFEVTATDLNSRSLERAQTGVYTRYSLRNAPSTLLRKYLRQYGDSFDVNDEVRQKVRFEQLNLFDSARMQSMSGFDVIFCCNVLIYFDLQSKKKVISQFFNGLLEGGYFFLGHSESLFGIDERFQLIHFPATTGYRKAH